MQLAHALMDTTGKLPWVGTQQASDQDLIARIAAGDKRATQVLFGRHNVRVYRFLLRILNDEALAEDIVSDVFLDVWRHAASFEGKSQVSTWILAIARFKALSALRRRKDAQLDDVEAAQIEDEADNPEVCLQKQDRSTILRRCLGQLSADHREVIDLVYYHEKSLDEVAEIVGVPVNTVKTRMFYARKRMSVLLQQAGMDQTCQ